MVLWEVSDEQGNKFYTERYTLAFTITKEKENPFINIMKVNDNVKIDKKHIINDYESFCEYFY